MIGIQRSRQTDSSRRYRDLSPDVAQSWRSTEFVALDFETSGLDLAHDEIISFGSVPIHGGRIATGEARYHVVRPRRRLRPESVTVHAIRDCDLEDAPKWDEVVDLLLDELAGRVVIAHAAWVERGFLQRALRCRDVAPPAAMIDTAALSRAAGVTRSLGRAEPGLEDLARRLRLPPHPPHHALADALMTAEVFLVLAARLDPTPGPGCSVGELVELSETHEMGAGA